MFTGLPPAATAWMKSVWRAGKAGALEHVDHRGGRAGSPDRMHIGQHRQAELLHRLEHFQAGVHPMAAGKLLPELRLALSNEALKM